MSSLLNEYLEEMKEDTALDQFTVRDVQMKLPGIKHKWAGRLIRAKIDINKLYGDRKRLINKLADKLVGASPVRLSMPVARKKVEDHEAVLEIDDKIKDCRMTQEFLEKAEKILSSMTFDIKNLTEIMKMELQ